MQFIEDVVGKDVFC